MRIINLTDHIVTVKNGDTEKVYFPSGTIARSRMKRVVIGKVDGVDVCQIIWEPAKGLPEESKDTYYIVSLIVFESTDRGDLLAPDTTRGSVIKHKDGDTIAVRFFKAHAKFANKRKE